MELKQAWYQEKHCDFWNNWVIDVFDLRTANEFGLSVWSVILDVKIFGQNTKSRLDYPAIYFGSTRKNFGHGNFARNASVIEGLTLDQKRIMLQLKAFIMNSNSSTYDINKKLVELFPNGEVKLMDNLNMTYTYIVSSDDNFEFAELLKEFDLLPRPNCVDIDVVVNN